MSGCLLLFPHQLFQEALSRPEGHVLLIEHPLFFSQYRFHRHKLILHHVAMRQFAETLRGAGKQVDMVPFEALEGRPLSEGLGPFDLGAVTVFDPVDDWLERDLQSLTGPIEVLDSPNFLCSRADLIAYRKLQGKRQLRMAGFYAWQRKRLGILLDSDGGPVGGKWSFDEDNRKPLPAKVTPPTLVPPAFSEAQRAWIAEAELRFAAHPATGEFRYPVDHDQAGAELEQFLDLRFAYFGDYEDALTTRSRTLFHSVLTPALNSGLIHPEEVVRAALERQADVSLNSLEGFVRQVIGWREFVRLCYRDSGRKMRTRNFLGHRSKLPERFWSGDTGIFPLDLAIRNVTEDGYTHHIERLMVLGTFMLLVEIHPDEVYEWFMAMFIDSYDWVMVPNVYGMSQYADGGGMTTKPYVCGSRYIRSMSDYPTGPWCEIWDALYWRWVSRHEGVMRRNPRSTVIVQAWKRFPAERKAAYLATAERFLEEFFAKS